MHLPIIYQALYIKHYFITSSQKSQYKIRPPEKTGSLLRIIVANFGKNLFLNSNSNTIIVATIV